MCIYVLESIWLIDIAQNAKGISLFPLWGGQHKRPVGSKCQVQNTASIESTSSGTHSNETRENTNSEILNALNAVSYRLTAIEQRIDRTEEQLQSRPKVVPDAPGSAKVSASLFQELDEESDIGDDAVIPITQFIKKTSHIQQAVDQRLKELTRMNEQGMFKYQRGDNEQIHVKCQVPWPQNFVLATSYKVPESPITAFPHFSGWQGFVQS